MRCSRVGVIGIALVVACSSDSAGDAGGAGSCADAPLDASCLGDATKTLFLSVESGSDVQGDGTRAHPFKSLLHTLQKVEGQRRRIYACGDKLTEQSPVELGPQHAALVLVGGLDCATWAPNGKRLVLASPFGSAITIRPAEAGVVIEGLELVAGGAEAGGSGRIVPWVAATVNNDTVFRRVRFVAPGGRRGDSGTSGQFRGGGFRPVENAYSSQGGRNMCSGSESRGGNGGYSKGQPGSPGPPNGGAGGVACDEGGSGGAGAPGSDGMPAAAITTNAFFSPAPPGPNGKVTDGHFESMEGLGSQGGTGGGGGGGAAGPAPANMSVFGGGGGFGGCASFTRGGTAGASSIAILTFGAKVTLRDSIIDVGNGGDGGAGVAGVPGSPGDKGAVVTSGGCPGGPGGKGGTAGASGGGAGGLSVGVVYNGPAPDLDDATRAATKLGAAGKGGAGGAPTNAGPDGVSAAVLELPLR